MPGALHGLKVVEVGSSAAVAYCGKLFADYGAEVLKVEPPGGDPLRRAWPLVRLDDGTTESGYAAWLNTNKQSVVADPAADGESLIASLCMRADILLDARGGEDRAARHDALRQRNPGLTIGSVSWFGESGPYAGFAGAENVSRALAGLGKLTGPAEGPPELLCEAQAGVVGGLTTFAAVLATRLSAHTGRRFEVSVHEASATLAEYEGCVARATPEIPEQRHGRNRFRPTFPLGIYPCREGWLGATVITPVQWRSFCEMLDLPHLADDPRFALNLGRFGYSDELEAQIVNRFAQRTAAEWFVLSRARKLPIVVMPDIPALLNQNVHRDRGAFGQVHIGSAAFEAPGLPYKLGLDCPTPGGIAPRAGEHTAAWLSTPAPPAAAHAVRTPPGRPLEGVRIVDLTMGWAGPLATRQLADLGADIVKVEACGYPDWWRGVVHDDASLEKRQYEKSLYFNILNRNKRGVTIDLTNPSGVALLKRLVAGADAVIENYSNEVLPKLGLDYAALTRVTSALVMVSMPAFGGGEWRDIRAYGSTLEHASGLPSVSGPPGAPPTQNQLAYGDPIGGLNATAALLIALMHRKRTGLGQHVDMSQVQGMIPLVAPWIIEYGITGRVTRTGNRHPGLAPHGCFRCAGADSWIALAVTDDAQWPALCRVIGRHDLARLGDVAARQDVEDAIEAAITAWTSSVDAEDAMAKLQAAGVPSGVVRSPGDMYDDPHLRARGSWQAVDRTWMGLHLQPSAPFREEGRPYAVMSPAPTLGEYNQAVFGGELGLADSELTDLAGAGVIGDKVIPIGQRKKQR